jgi:hypothetical protein
MIEQLRKARVQVWGDGILDVYHYGRSDRICPEAPVPVFIETSRDSRAGGAANVVRNLDTLGVRTISTLSEFVDWSEKHRYLVSGHQLLRVDADKMSKPGRAELRKDVDCLVISDYAKAIGCLQLLFDTECFFLHGPVTSLGDRFCAEVVAAVRATMPALAESPLRIVPSALGDDAGALGAASLAMESWVPAFAQ